MAALVRRQRGSTTLYVIALYSLILLFVILGCLIGYWAGLDINFTGCSAAVVALLVWHFIGRRYLVWQFRKNMMARGVPMHVPVRVDISPEALVYDSKDVVHHVLWRGVSELYRKKGYWIFMVHSTGYYVAARFFADKKNELAFITEALSYMSDEARARSKGARKFVETAGA